jgi:thymidylate synthase ThyX
MDFFDAPPRPFEFISISFEALVSSSCYAQIKRHRMASLLSGPYSPVMGYTIPQQIRDAGLTKEFEALMLASHTFYEQNLEKLGPAAQYALSNAHRRRVTMRLNLRDLYHFVRLRADVHAQWEIRDLALVIEERIRKELPLTSMLLAGKDHFPARHEALPI